MLGRIKKWARAQGPNFWLMVFCVGILTWSNVNLRDKIYRLQTYISDHSRAITALEEHSGNQGNQLIDQEHELSSLKGQMVVLDAAINSDKLRKARIQKVRDAIKEEVASISSMQALPPERLSQIATAIVDYSDAQMLPVALLTGLIRQESAFNCNAVSKAGAKGCTQVMDSTAEDIKARKKRNYYNPFNINHNIDFGATYLSQMMHLFDNDIEKALWAYNAGPQMVQLYLSGVVEKLPKETQAYAPAVLAYMKEFEARGIH